jgi:uncharacterized protein
MTPLHNVATLEAHFGDFLAEERFHAAVMSFFALSALFLTPLGVYGVLASQVADRTREIGIRKALGAEAGDIVSIVVGRGTRLVLFGLFIGGAAVFALSRPSTVALFGMEPPGAWDWFLSALALTMTGLLTSVRRELRERFTVVRIGVFGSWARGEEAPDSDVDILVELADPTFDRYMDLKFRLEELLERPVDLVPADTVKPRIKPIIEREVVYA